MKYYIGECERDLGFQVLERVQERRGKPLFIECVNGRVYAVEG